MDSTRPTASLTVSVIVPVYNGGVSFQECLSSLKEMMPAPQEIIVVADGDTDGSSRLAETYGMRVVRLPEQSGPARARNVGARAAQGDILFFVDADVAIKPDAIERVTAAFIDDPDLCALFGSYDDAPAAENFLSQYRNLLHHYVHQNAREEASTCWGAGGAIRREVFLSVDGFDESYRQPCIEDIELGYRLTKGGCAIQLKKALQGKHLKRWSAVSMLKADFFKRALPWTDLILRDRQFVNDLNTDLASRVSVMSVYGLLGSLIVAPLQPGFLVVSSVLVLLLLAMNAALYGFFWRKRGLWFTIQTLPWHWFYYFYSGLAFGIGLARFQFKAWSRRSMGAQASPGGLSYTED
jgi:glycosyltransferase involved in cell wall biosynthesis